MKEARAAARILGILVAVCGGGMLFASCGLFRSAHREALPEPAPAVAVPTPPLAGTPGPADLSSSPQDASFGGGEGASWRDLSFHPIRSFTSPEPKRDTLANGVVVYSLEDHEVPLVDLELRLPAGFVFDPPDRQGLAAVTAAAIHYGGTAQLTGDEVEAFFESHAAEVRFEVAASEVTITIACLSEALGDVLDVLSRVLREPAFRESGVDLARGEIRGGIRGRNDDVDALAAREFQRILLGPEHAFVRRPEYTTVEAITREDCEDFHAVRYRPDHLVIGAWGDFRRGDLMAVLGRDFGDWIRIGEESPRAVPVSQRERAGLWFGEKAGQVQTRVVMGHVGDLRRDDADYPTVYLLNEILGGTRLGTSRLARRFCKEIPEEVRVRSRYGAGFEQPGVFSIELATRPERIGEAVALVLDEIARLRQEPVDPAEVQRAKDAVLSSFVFRFDEPGEIVRRWLEYHTHGYPMDSLERFRAGIANVTPQNVQRAASVYLHTDRLVVLAVGSPARSRLPLEEVLSDLGAARRWDLSIAPPPRPRPADFDRSPEAAERGRGALFSWIQASGGARAVDLLADASYRGEATLTSGEDSFAARLRREYLFPDYVRQELEQPLGHVTQVWTPQAVWVEGSTGIVPLPRSAVASERNERRLDFLPLLRLAANGTLTAYPLGREVLGGRTVVFQRIEGPDGLAADLGFNTETGLLAAIRTTAPPQAGETRVVERLFGDYRRVGDLLLPHRIAVYEDSRLVFGVDIEGWRINVGLDSDRFQVPPVVQTFFDAIDASAKERKDAEAAEAAEAAAEAPPGGGPGGAGDNPAPASPPAGKSPPLPPGAPSDAQPPDGGSGA